MSTKWLGCVVFALCVMTTAVFAGHRIAGTWSSTSGSTIVIPDSNTAFTLSVTHKDGKQFQLHATWQPGLVGAQFAFKNEYGRRVIATIDPKNPDRVHLVVEDRNYLWTRLK